MTVLAILCPVYNEEAVLKLFFERLRPVLEALSGRYECRLVFLNNASTDGTLAKVAEVRAVWEQTFVISMSRNVGYQASVECGVRRVEADVYVVIDVDCEDPPEMIPAFLAKYEEGFDIAYGERVDRPEPRAIKAGRKFFYRLLRMIADEDILLDMAEFSLFSREVRDAIIVDESSFPFLRGSIARVGFRRAAIPFTRQKRIAGETHYNLVGMTIFAVAGLLASSTLLLRLPVYMLPFWLVTLCLLGLLAVAGHSAWAVFFGCLVFAGYVGASISFIALYVARAYKNGLRRPNAVIDTKLSRLPPACEAK